MKRLKDFGLKLVGQVDNDEYDLYVLNKNGDVTYKLKCDDDGKIHYLYKQKFGFELSKKYDSLGRIIYSEIKYIGHEPFISNYTYGDNWQRCENSDGTWREEKYDSEGEIIFEKNSNGYTKIIKNNETWYESVMHKYYCIKNNHGNVIYYKDNNGTTLIPEIDEYGTLIKTKNLKSGTTTHYYKTGEILTKEFANGNRVKNLFVDNKLVLKLNYLKEEDMLYQHFYSYQDGNLFEEKIEKVGVGIIGIKRFDADENIIYQKLNGKELIVTYENGMKVVEDHIDFGIKIYYLVEGILRYENGQYKLDGMLCENI